MCVWKPNDRENHRRYWLTSLVHSLQGAWLGPALALKKTWEEHKETLKEKMKASEWAFDRIKEAFDLVAKDEVEKMSIIQEIMLKSTDYLRRIIAPVGGQGAVTMSYLFPHCNIFSLEHYVWWVTAGKTTKWWCAICGDKYDWKQPNRLLVVQTGKVLSRRRSSKRMQYSRAYAGICEW